MRRFLKDYVVPYWKQILILLVFVVLQVYLQLQVLSETHAILNGGVANQDMGFIKDAGVRMILMTLVYGLSIVLVSYLSAYLSASVTCDVRRDLFKRIMTFSQKDFSRFGGSTLMTRLTADTTRIQIFMLNALRNARMTSSVSTNILSNIENEYIREFAGEGQLFWYYKRNNMPSIPAIYDRSRPNISMSTANYVFELPQSEDGFRD